MSNFLRRGGFEGHIDPQSGLFIGGDRTLVLPSHFGGGPMLLPILRKVGSTGVDLAPQPDFAVLNMRISAHITLHSRLATGGNLALAGDFVLSHGGVHG